MSCLLETWVFKLFHVSGSQEKVLLLAAIFEDNQEHQTSGKWHFFCDGKPVTFNECVHKQMHLIHLITIIKSSICFEDQQVGLLFLYFITPWGWYYDAQTFRSCNNSHGMYSVNCIC